MGSPFRLSVVSRLDKNDSIIVFDKVFVPFENVFAYLAEIPICVGRCGASTNAHIRTKCLCVSHLHFLIT